MARTLESIIQSRQQQLEDELPWVWLYEFEVPTTPATRFRLTNYTETVQFGENPDTGTPIEYQPYPIEHGEIELNREGNLPTITVTVANVAREVGEYLDTYGGLVNQPAVVRLVNIGSSGTPTAGIRFDSQISRARLSPEAALLELAAVNLRRIKLPRRRYMREDCPFVFGGSECGYQIPGSATETVGGGFARCPKTLAACTARGLDEAARSLTNTHPLRFGGFLGIGRQER